MRGRGLVSTSGQASFPAVLSTYPPATSSHGRLGHQKRGRGEQYNEGLEQIPCPSRDPPPARPGLEL